MSATLNGHRVTSARATIPAWGCWHAEASIDGEHTLAGTVTLKIADLTLVGTVLSGGPTLGRSTYRIVAGKGGWGRTVPKKSYANDASDKVSTVLGDAAREVGEILAAIASTDRVGLNYTRPEGPASALLERYAPGAWYVDEAGVTHLGARNAGVLPAKVTRIAPVDLAVGKVVLASESIATILPGVVVDGLTAVDVEHTISAEGGIRSTVWGGQMGGILEQFRKLADQLDPLRKFRGVTEYRVLTLEGSRVNLQPVRSSLGMPDLARVKVRPGVAGCEATLALGARVLVGFVDSDPASPYVASAEDADGGGFLPTLLELCGGDAAVARVGDEITITGTQITTATMVAGANPVTVTLPLKGTITSGSSKVKAG